MSTKECVAMILAGGHGKRLGALTRYYSKPALYFGGYDRIIDFSLNNCQKSGIDTVGILSQHFSTDLNTYINNRHNWKPEQSGINILTPQNGEEPYSGTADAIYKNIEFIDQIDPDFVLILAGDHIYKMNYKKMIAFHKETSAALTVASTTVPIGEATKFGIINSSKESWRMFGFEEKPLRPKSDLASMGIYVFKWSILKEYLLADSKNEHSQHDFGHNILPEMLSNDESIYAYRYKGYWRDVGTVDSLWEANMDRIDNPAALQLEADKYFLNSYNNDISNTILQEAVIYKSILSGNCSIFGKVVHSVLSDSVTVGLGSEVVNSVIMPGVYIGNNVKIYNAIVGTKAVIMDNTIIGSNCGEDFFVDRQVCLRGVSLIEPWLYVDGGMEVQKNSQISKEKLESYRFSMPEETKYTVVF